MRAFTIGSLYTRDGVEAWKWAALSCMVIEHVLRYGLGKFPLAVFVAGRLVFPLFALALGIGLAGQWRRDKVARLVGKLVLWGTAAAVLRMLVLPTLPLNVLFTFAVGVALFFAWTNARWSRILLLIASITIGMRLEFGAWGIFAVALFCAYGESRRWEHLLAAIACVCFSQMTWVPLLALPIAAALEFVADGLPRWRGGFYWAYVLQWPLIAGVAWFVAR